MLEIPVNKGDQTAVALIRWIQELEARVAKLECRPYCHDEQTWVPNWCDQCERYGYFDAPCDCDCWEYEDWTFGDLEPGDWFEHDGVEWKKVECHYWANARSGDVVDRFFEDEVVYPFEWGD